MEEAVGTLIRIRLWLIALSVSIIGSGNVGAQNAAVAPIAQAYAYLEPFEARVEVLYDLNTVLGWLNQPTEPAMLIAPETQQSIRTQAGKLGSDWCRLIADGTEQQGKLSSVALVKGKPGNTLPMPDGDRAAVSEVMVGFVYEFSIPGGPAKIEVRFKPFMAPVTQLPLTYFFGSQSEAQTMSGTLPIARWTNSDRLPKPKPLAELPKIEMPEVYHIPLVTIIWGLFGVGLYIWVDYKQKKFPGGAAPFFAAWVIGMVMTWNMDLTFDDPFAKQAPMISTPAQAEAVLTPLLKNVYRAFDYRKEQDIYDRLDHSVHGDLLRRLYLQTVAALTLEGQDGTRTSISELSVDIGRDDDGEKAKKNPDWKKGPDESVKAAAEGFIAECQWTAMGTVGHWGHQHTRVNRYKAKVTVKPIQTEWKLSDLEVLEERRL